LRERDGVGTEAQGAKCISWGQPRGRQQEVWWGLPALWDQTLRRRYKTLLRI